LSAVFADTSAMAAVLFHEPACDEVMRVLSLHDRVYASSLLESEMFSVASRMDVELKLVERALENVVWVCPDRTLNREIRRIMATGVPLRGADLWHVACALYLAVEPSFVPFLTLDHRQAQAARALGFTVLPHGRSHVPGVEEDPASYRIRPAGRSKRNKG
jgi:predicted nucleic acid-binding protein